MTIAAFYSDVRSITCVRLSNSVGHVQPHIPVFYQVVYDRYKKPLSMYNNYTLHKITFENIHRRLTLIYWCFHETFANN